MIGKPNYYRGEAELEMMVQILGNSPNIMSMLLKEKALNLLKCVLCALDLKYIYIIVIKKIIEVYLRKNF